LTEVNVKVLVPAPLEVLEDKVAFVAVMVKLGVAASAGKPAKTKLAVKSSPRTTSTRLQRIAQSFPQAACTPSVGLDDA
jgi:hypothetical protein